MKAKLLYLVAALLWPGFCLADEKPPAKPSAETPAEPKRLPFSEAEREQVLESARAFIAEVDRDDGNYWDHFAELVKKTTSKIQWSVAIGAMKLSCGAIVKRSNARGDCFDRLPDAPKGRYFIIDIDSEFSRMNVRERVVLVKESEVWKIAGYFRFKEFGSKNP